MVFSLWLEKKKRNWKRGGDYERMDFNSKLEVFCNNNTIDLLGVCLSIAAKQVTPKHSSNNKYLLTYTVYMSQELRRGTGEDSGVGSLLEAVVRILGGAAVSLKA